MNKQTGEGRLELKDVESGYGNLPILHGVSLEVEPAEIVAVMGGWPPRPGGVEDAMALVDDALVSDLIAHGTPEECVESAERWRREGLDQIVLIPLSRNYDEILEVFAP